jgi:hypothetical protein
VIGVHARQPFDAERFGVRLDADHRAPDARELRIAAVEPGERHLVERAGPVQHDVHRRLGIAVDDPAVGDRVVDHDLLQAPFERLATAEHRGGEGGAVGEPVQHDRLTRLHRVRDNRPRRVVVGVRVVVPHQPTTGQLLIAVGHHVGDAAPHRSRLTAAGGTVEPNDAPF